jgi:hypothetical protein
MWLSDRCRCQRLPRSAYRTSSSNGLPPHLGRVYAPVVHRPRAHGDHFHVGPVVVSVHDATGLGNPSVLNALARKGLLLAGRSGLPVLTAEGLAYNTGIAAEILHGDDH